MASPKDGYLAGPQDLEQIMSLDDWLYKTDGLRNDRHLDDAWADRSTNCAFAFNNTIGVEKAHASNVWTDGWSGEEDVPHPYLDKTGHGLYVYIPRPPVILEYLTQPQTTHSTFANDELTNDGDVATNETRSYEEEQGEQLSISNTTTIGFKAKGGFEMEGFSFEAETSLEQSNTEAKTQSSITKTNQTITIPLPAKKTVVFTWAVFTTTQDIRYGLDVELGEASSEGSIAKATNRGHRGDWNYYMKLSDVLDYAGKHGQNKQTIEYNVTKTTKLTKVFIGEKQADGSISWTGEQGAPPV